MKKIFFLLCLSFLLSAHTDYEAWKKQQLQAQKEFISKQDKQFSDYLEAHWKAFEIVTAIPMDATPKPDNAPVQKLEEIVQIPKTKNLIDSIFVPELKIMEKITYEIQEFVSAESQVFEFWGLHLLFDVSAFASIQLEKENINEKLVADFWYKMSSAEYQPFLKKIQDYRSQIRVNDWGYCQLIRTIATQIWHNDETMANLFSWFVLVKSGFDAKVSFAENNVFLMIPSRQNLYNAPYLNIDGRNYYLVFNAIIPPQLALFTYEKKYPDASDVVNLNVTEIPAIPSVLIKRDLIFSYLNIEYPITLEFDKNLCQTKSSFPQTDLFIYFQSPLSSALLHSAGKEFKPILEGKSESVALDMLLRFVQTAFPYKTDDEQFGLEKVMFPDEMLFYEFSDCEDRSIFFAALVKHVLNLDVIALDYPGHIATAIHLIENIPGDFIQIDGKRYLICDPTYINASIGMTMPKYKTVQPEIIEY
jgi:hypothetical protein